MLPRELIWEGMAPPHISVTEYSYGLTKTCHCEALLIMFLHWDMSYIKVYIKIIIIVKIIINKEIKFKIDIL